MKTRTTILVFITVLLLLTSAIKAQITTPVIRAGFGLDADLHRNYFNQAALSGNDDWFGAPTDTATTGDAVIDTTGAASVYAAYTTNPASRFYSFTRGMRYPILSVVNDRIYYDAVYIRDYHGTDSTSFTGGSKNGQSPADWSTAVSPVLSKNDIIDGYLHVRRDGTHTGDTLWFFGGVGILGTNGDRYFDFELYQTDIKFNRGTGKFENYGPDAGHTGWMFNDDGSTAQVGDIILTAEYGNAGLNFIEARIWVNKNFVTKITPLAFSWSGTFDGDGNGADFGYAGILPVTGGSFYQGLQNSAQIPTGPFGTIQSGDLPSMNYNAIQFMEFSVNLTKLGLDPMSFTTGSLCNLAFGKVLIKTRTSTSFTASITDFASPFSFRALPQTDIAADIPLFCLEQNIATISVLNPLPTSTYTFSTTDGHIFSTNATSIVVDSPGTYIVIQHLLDGCAEGGRDTVRIIRQANNSCIFLAAPPVKFNATIATDNVLCKWDITGPAVVSTVQVERAAADKQFITLCTSQVTGNNQHYTWTDYKPGSGQTWYYRLRILYASGEIKYSQIIAIHLPVIQLPLRISPNPVHTGQTVNLCSSSLNGNYRLRITDQSGRAVYGLKLNAENGRVLFEIPPLPGNKDQLYFITVWNNREIYSGRLLIVN